MRRHRTTARCVAMTWRPILRLQFGRDNFVTTRGGGHASLGNGNPGAGSCVGVLCSGADQAACEMGRADGGRVSTGNWQGARNVPTAIWDIGKARAALAAG